MSPHPGVSQEAVPSPVAKGMLSVFCITKKVWGIHNSIDWLNLMDWIENFANQQTPALVWWPKSCILTLCYYTFVRDVTGIILYKTQEPVFKHSEWDRGVITDEWSRCNTALQAAIYVGMHGYLGWCMVLQSLLVYFASHCYRYIFLINFLRIFYYLFVPFFNVSILFSSLPAQHATGW